MNQIKEYKVREEQSGFTAGKSYNNNDDNGLYSVTENKYTYKKTNFTIN